MENCSLTMHVRGVYARKFFWQLNLNSIGLQTDYAVANRSLSLQVGSRWRTRRVRSQEPTTAPTARHSLAGTTDHWTRHRRSNLEAVSWSVYWRHQALVIEGLDPTPKKSCTPTYKMFKNTSVQFKLPACNVSVHKELKYSVFCCCSDETVNVQDYRTVCSYVTH